MTRKNAIEESFRKLVLTTPYNKITIDKICEHAGVSRKMFYQIFRNKEDVVESIFEHDAIEPIRNINESLDPSVLTDFGPQIMEIFYQGIYDKKEYYSRLAKTAVVFNDVFIKAVIRAEQKWNMWMLPRVGAFKSEWEKNYVCYFFSSSQAMLIQRWINDDMDKTPQEISTFFYSITEAFWYKLLDRE